MSENALDKTFTPADIEPRQYDVWRQSGLFEAKPDSDKEPYTIMMPPPNVTGSLHIGHALNHTLQDILVRYHRLRGKDVLWQPGMDHASIAVHMVLENKLAAEGKTRFDLGREEFMTRAWEWREESGGMIFNQLGRLGTTPDWTRERFTMDEGCSKAVLKAFVQLYKEKLIYRAERLVNWDPVRQTVVSDLEVDHREIKGKLYHFAYPYEDGSGHVEIATTRPETILADGAVAVHPDDERYKDKIGKFVVVPVINRIIPVIADAYVDPDFGSGAVKITAAHDFNDFEVYERHKDKGIPLINLFTPDAKMNENCPEDYQGLDRFEARKKVIADFDELDYLIKIEDHVHQVPYGERSGEVIEPYLTTQWFCDAPTLAKEAGAAIRDGRAKFVPKQYENMYFSWVDHMLPWCISRQLWWGHQIPAWYGPDGEVFVAETEENAYAQAKAHYQEDVHLNRDEDVLDTWFSSALWPFSTQGWPEDTTELAKYYPGDVLITAFDIIFFWVARMMMFGLHFMKDVPFKDIYIHALVRDSKGQKMSKSKGNIIDPIDLIDQFGADALRFTLAAMAAQGRDIKLSEDRVAGYRNFATKLWNASRYAEMNGCTYPDDFDVSAIKATPNVWIVHSLREIEQDLSHALETYRFNDAANVLYQFVWGTYCDWYLEFTKPLLNGDDQNLATETKATTAWVLDQILILLNPFMPFITEELSEKLKLGQPGLVMGKAWPDYPEIWKNANAAEEMEWLIDLISTVRSVRSDMNVPAGENVQLLLKDVSEDNTQRLVENDIIIKKMARLSSIEITGDAFPKGSIQAVVDEATIAMPIADIIDLDKERARLRKEISKLEKDLKTIEGKLGNANFVEKAPQEVIDEQYARKEEASQTLRKLQSALEQLEAA